MPHAVTHVLTARLDTATVVERVRHLPALPAVVHELIASLDDENIGTERLAAIVSRDQALAAKTLRLANSSFYGVSRQVLSVADAAAILGLRTVRSVAIAAGLAAAFEPTRCPGFDFGGFWRHAAGTALCARELAQRGVGRQAEAPDPGAAFALGLLHDIGRLALASHFCDAYAAVLAHRDAHDLADVDAELAVLGIDHAAVGALIAEHWRFAPATVAAIASHHRPGEIADTGLADLVHVADNIAHALDLSQVPDDAVPALSLGAWSRLALDEATCLPMFRTIECEHAVLCGALLDRPAGSA